MTQAKSSGEQNRNVTPNMYKLEQLLQDSIAFESNSEPQKEVNPASKRLPPSGVPRMMSSNLIDDLGTINKNVPANGKGQKEAVVPQGKKL